jgi:hypothetical protein
MAARHRRPTRLAWPAHVVEGLQGLQGPEIGEVAVRGPKEGHELTRFDGRSGSILFQVSEIAYLAMLRIYFSISLRCFLPSYSFKACLSIQSRTTPATWSLFCSMNMK